jgi:hypothetical protein
MNLAATDMVEAVSDLLKHGYDHEYRIRDGQLYDLTANKPVAARDIHVDLALRFESAPDAADGSNIYAIADRSTGGKGLLIDAFDALDRECSRELYEQLSDEPSHTSQQRGRNTKPIWAAEDLQGGIRRGS